MSALSKLFSTKNSSIQQQQARSSSTPGPPPPSAGDENSSSKAAETTKAPAAPLTNERLSFGNKAACFLGLGKTGNLSSKPGSPRTTISNSDNPRQSIAAASALLAAGGRKDEAPRESTASVGDKTRGSFRRNSSFGGGSGGTGLLNTPGAIRRGESISEETAQRPSESLTPVDESVETLHSLEWRAIQTEQLAQFNARRTMALAPSPIQTLSEAGYEPDRLIGGGAFGWVITAHPKSNPEQRVAVKCMLKREIVRSKATQFVINEKGLLMALDFPYICKLYMAFKDTCYLYFVMKFSNGGNVFEVMRNDSDVGPWPEHACKFYTAQIVLALEYIHMLNILFRDLKPENLTFSANGDCVLIDFGMARLTKGRAYTVCGSLPYMAPEMIERKGYGFSVDYWALGCIVYEMFTRKRAFHVSHEENLLSVVLRNENAVKNNQEIPDEPRDLLYHLIESDLSKRFGTLKNGVNDIKAHSWFADVDWLRLYKGGYEPPYKPNVVGEYDDTNFKQLPNLKWETSAEMLHTMDFYGF